MDLNYWVRRVRRLFGGMRVPMHGVKGQTVIDRASMQRGELIRRLRAFVLLRKVREMQ